MCGVYTQRPNSQSLTGGYSRLWRRVVIPARQPQSGNKNLASGLPSICNYIDALWYEWVSVPYQKVVLSQKEFLIPVKQDNQRVYNVEGLKST
jgi:hypothetical protein